MSSSSLSLTSSLNSTSQYPQYPEDISPNNNPLSPHPVEENLFDNEEFEDELEDEQENEEDLEAGYEEDDEEEEEEEEEETSNQPPPPVYQGPRIRFVLNRPTVGTLAPAAATVAPPPESASSSNTPIMSHDPYFPPGYIPLPTYPRLAQEIGSHEHRISLVEDTIDLFPEPHQLETMRQNIQQLEQANRQLTNNQRYNEQRILDLENQAGRMQAQIDAMNQMIADIYRHQK